jgi:phage baseplate assembly protein W
MPIGLTLPFARATGSVGHLDFTSDELSAVKENLKSLLVTNWGERVMHFNFGCNLIEFLFENDKGPELKERIADRIISQVSTWMPFVGVDELNILFPEEDDSLPEHAIGIRISFRLLNRPDFTSILNFAVSAGTV